MLPILEFHLQIMYMLVTPSASYANVVEKHPSFEIKRIVKENTTVIKADMIKKH